MTREGLKMLTIYGADLSSPSNKVRFVANELGLDYTYKSVNLVSGENRSEEHLKLHPAGKVPVIDDDGFVLFESNAIIRYLATKHESPLYPAGARQRALVDQWADFVAHHIATAVSRVLVNRVFAPFLNQEVDERSITEGLAFLERFLPVLDAPLQERRYLAGGELTLADFNLLAAIDPAEVAQIELSGYLNITRWRQDLTGRDFYTRCHKSYGDVLAAIAGG
jgi:glutathione S-transferase